MKIAVDFETYYDDECSVSKTSPWAYCRHPKFDAYMISVSDGADTWAGHPNDFNWDALHGAQLFAHNAAFDSTVYESLVEAGKAPRIAVAGWECTANLSSFFFNRRALGPAIERAYGLHLHKGMRSWMKGNYWSDAVAAGKAEDLLRYARIDALQCARLANDYYDKWPAHEVALSQLTLEQARYGVAVDADKLRADIQYLTYAIWETERALPWFTEGKDFAPTSPKRIAEECRKEGIPCPPVKSHEGGEEAFIEWEIAYGPRYPWVAAVSRWRSLNKVMGTLETIKNRLRPDGTINFSLKYFGGHTGRWSGDAGLNMQNLRKEPLYFADGHRLVEDAPTLAAIFRGEFTPHYVIDVRALFVPRPGKKFIICDLAQIEPRVLAWMTNDVPFLDAVRTGMSIYEAHARMTLGWTGGDLKKENKDLYKLAKAQKLALGYGCGAEKYVTAAKVMADYDITPEEAAIQVPQFREQNPLITGLWKRLDTQLKNSVGGDFTVDLPAGRSMRYEKVRRSPTIVKDRKTGEMRQSMAYTADIGGFRKKLYGGLLVENCLSGETEVRTARGWVFLKDILPEDLLWDGVEFVSHGGLVSKGRQDVIDFGGVQMTPDHEVYSKDGWQPAAQADAESAKDFYGA